MQGFPNKYQEFIDMIHSSNYNEQSSTCELIESVHVYPLEIRWRKAPDNESACARNQMGKEVGICIFLVGSKDFWRCLDFLINSLKQTSYYT